MDDDAAFRRSLVFLLESMGWEVVTHASADAFLQQGQYTTGCRHRLPAARCAHARHEPAGTAAAATGAAVRVPIVFLTGHGDVELAV